MMRWGTLCVSNTRQPSLTHALVGASCVIVLQFSIWYHVYHFVHIILFAPPVASQQQQNMDDATSVDVEKPIFLETGRSDTCKSDHQIHWLPCSIEHDGPAPVDQYFIAHGMHCTCRLYLTPPPCMQTIKQRCAVAPCEVHNSRCRPPLTDLCCSQHPPGGKALADFHI